MRPACARRGPPVISDASGVIPQCPLAAQSAACWPRPGWLTSSPSSRAWADFDFGFVPSIDRQQIQALATLPFLANGENVIFLGPQEWARPIWPSPWAWWQWPTAPDGYFVPVPELLEERARDVQRNRLSERLRSLASPRC